MAVDVTTFSAMARSEFLNANAAAAAMQYPAEMAQFTTTINSTTKVETHTWLSALPRLKEFNGISAATRLIDKTYTVTNKRHRIGPVTVDMDALADDQIGGYIKTIQSMPEQARKDIGYLMLAHLAAGTAAANTCFDGSVFFANSHTFGSGDNLDTYDGAANDGVTHKVIALITNNPFVKPLMYQEREGLTGLLTDADTPQALEATEFKYWADARFGKGYGFWWDAIHMTITDTPTILECHAIIRQIINLFRTFTLPKGNAADDALYIHEGWVPSADNFVLLCNMKLAEVLSESVSTEMVPLQSNTGMTNNIYRNKAKVLATSALGA